MDQDIFTRITESIVASMEDALKWDRPWIANGKGGMPSNVESKKSYNGANVLQLWASADRSGFTSDTWGTYNQWAERGAQVRKGEKSTSIVFWKPLTRKDDEESTFMMARGYNVFNAAQVEDYVEPVITMPSLAQRIASAEELVRDSGARVFDDGGGRAFYRPATDSIHMPVIERFLSTQGYYGTLLHELTHWTGHESRMDRKKMLGKRFGDANYAMEELVAELGATFMCAKLGIIPDATEENKAYIQSWLKVLKNDKKAIFTAASQASKAIEWVTAPRVAVAA